MASVKPASGIGNARAVNRANPSGLVKPKGFDQEFSTFKASPQVSSQLPGAVNPSPQPWDSIAEGKAAAAGANYKNAVDQTAANRATGLSEYGLEHELGLNGVYDDDLKNNPFSQAAVLQHNHESAQRGILTTAGQAGYSGQTGNAQGAETGRTNQSHQALVNEQERAKAGWIAEEKAAERARNEAVEEAKEGAINRAVEADKPEVPVGNTTINKTVVKKVVKPKKGK